MSKTVFSDSEDGIEYKIYIEDHGKPHFNAWYEGCRFKYTIETLELIGIHRPGAGVERKIRKYAIANRHKLLNGWSKVYKPEYATKEPMTEKQKKKRESKRKKR